MFRNHEGGREKSHHSGEIYKRRVREYWEARGYDCIADSKDDNITSDLILRQTHDIGNYDIWVETKNTKLGRTKKDFITEFARYLIEYQELPEEDPFDLHLFARYLEAPKKWERIFKVAKQTDDAVQTFYDRFEEKAELDEAEWEKFNSYSFEEFKEFVTKTTVHQASFRKLEEEIEDLEGSERYSRDTFTAEREPINEREELESNFVEISDPPRHIYIGNVDVPQFHDGVRQRLKDTDPFRFESNKVYSLLPPEDFPDYVEHVTEMDTVESESFSDWAKEEENTQLACTLLLREICRQNIEKHRLDDCVAFKYLGNYYLMFEHGPLQKEEIEVRGRQVSRVFDEGDSRFVRHRTAQLNIRRLNDDYFLFILVKDHFTENGNHMTLIRGDNKKRLHEHFNQNRYRNSQVYSRYRHMRDILGIHNRTTDTSGQKVGYRKVTEISVGKRPAGDKKEIDTRDTDSKQRKLGDSF